MRGHLLTAAGTSERSDLVAGMDEIERVRLQLTVEQIELSDQFYVGDFLFLQE